MKRFARKVIIFATSMLLIAGSYPAMGASTQSVAAKAVTTKSLLTFTAKTVEGKTFSSKILLGKKPTVLWFWAPWCAICHNESVQMVEAATKYGDKVNFIGIGALGTSAEMKVFVDETGTQLFTNLDDSKGVIWQRFGVVLQPTLIFIDSKGKLTSHIGPSDSDFLFNKLKAITK